MVAYWHWHSLHYGQETYWRGVLSHDLEPNRVFAEVARLGAELRRIGPRLANLKKSNKVAILYSSDSYHALQFMPFSDRVNYMSVLGQMAGALYRLNLEPDYVTPESDWAPYRLLLVPPLYSASEETCGKLARFVEQGGRAVVSFKSCFANEHSTVRHQMAPGPLRKAAGFRYQEFSNLAKPLPLKSGLGAALTGSVWAEFLIPETATAVATYDHPFFGRYPAMTRNQHGRGSLTYLGTHLSDEGMNAVLLAELRAAKLQSGDQELPAAVRVRHGQDNRGKALHYYMNFSGQEQEFRYGYGAAADLLTGRAAVPGALMRLGPWDLMILAED